MADDAREQAGRESAWERYKRLHGAGEPTDWSAFCTVPDYCTTPCDDCRRDTADKK